MGAVRHHPTSIVSGICRNAAPPLTGWRPRQAVKPPYGSPWPEIAVPSAISSEQFIDVSIRLAQVAQETRSRTPAVGQPMHYRSSFPTHKPHRPTRRGLYVISHGRSRSYANPKQVPRAMLLLFHRKHLAYREPVPTCAVDSSSLEIRAVSLADTAISRTALSDISPSSGPRHMDKQFLQEGDLRYASQRSRKEDTIETRDLIPTGFSISKFRAHPTHNLGSLALTGIVPARPTRSDTVSSGSNVRFTCPGPTPHLYYPRGQ
jgi:hypothetical protein